MEYVTRTPILAFQYKQEPLDQLPAWIAENAAQPPAKNATGTLMVATGGQNAYGPAHELVEPGSYLVFIAGRFETYNARRFEALFMPAPQAEVEVEAEQDTAEA